MKNLIVIASVILASSISFAYDKDKIELYSNYVKSSLASVEDNLTFVQNTEEELAVLDEVTKSVDFGSYLILFQIDEKSKMRASGVIELNSAIEKVEDLTLTLKSKARILKQINKTSDPYEVADALKAALLQLESASKNLKLMVIEAEDF